MNSSQRVAQKETKGTKGKSKSRRRFVLFVGFCSTLACQLLLPFAQPAHAATNDLTSLLQRGLFEEEANRNLDAAIASYDALAMQFDKNRQIAATAIFRLGECYRKLGRTNDAVQQYERIVRDFSDQQTLVTLSRQNLAGMGIVANRITDLPSRSESPTPSAAAEELMRSEKILAQLAGWDFPRLRRMIPTLIPDAEFEGLEAALTKWENMDQTEAVRGARTHIEGNLKKRAEVLIKTLEVRIAGLRERLNQEASTKTQQATNSAEVHSVLDEEEKEIRRLQAMIQNSPDLINAPTGEPRLTPLARAARAGQLRVAEFLLKSGAEVNRISGTDAPLHHAVQGGHKAAVELLIKNGADINSQNAQGGDTALHIAAGFGFQAVAETLIHHKADPNAKNRQGETPLHEAAQNGRVSLMELLIAAGADVNALDHGGITVLSKSLSRNQGGAIEVLLKAKADPNAGTTNQPLLVAIEMRDAAVARRLLEAGADPNKLGRLSRSVTLLGNSTYHEGTPIPPLHYALHHGAELVELLLKFGANPNVRDPEGVPLILSWSVWSRTNILESMLKAGADPNARDEHSQSPLKLAAGSGNPAAVELLLRHKADVQATDKGGWTALHAAIRQGSRGVMEALLKAGAEPNARNNEGKTPLDFAKERINPPAGAITFGFNEQLPADAMKPEEIIALLRQHGALDDLPDFTSIRVTRQGMSRPRVVFQSDPAVSNRFTVLETLLRFYTLRGNGPGGGTLFSQDSPPEELAFPDLKRIIVHRPARTGKGGQTIPVNLLNATNRIDCSQDIPLEFGDVVEVPVREYALREERVGLTREQWGVAFGCLKAEVRVSVRNESRTIQLYPADAFLRATLHDGKVQSLLLSSSDLSRVKVTRRDAASGKKQEWVLNCGPKGDNTNPGGQLIRLLPAPPSPRAGSLAGLRSSENSAPSTDLWLRDGDVIEIPEK